MNWASLSAKRKLQPHILTKIITSRTVFWRRLTPCQFKGYWSSTLQPEPNTQTVSKILQNYIDIISLYASVDYWKDYSIKYNSQFAETKRKIPDTATQVLNAPDVIDDFCK